MSRDHAYAYEAGYRDGSVHYELEHCPACKNVADLQEALEENAKLRMRVASLESALEGMHLIRDMDLAENATLRQQLADVTESMGRVEERCAKLREMVRDMHVVISDRNSWWDCTRKDTRRFADRMRELGVEVDG